ncbi:DUF4179 domain-containing protein [Paenibacillus motobuensis]|uniref:DUF4179 domain-containing protein n=1 Tax=Paenibacillus motobuensis TaxID=295324 RepID=A0ABN0YQ24_9BACL
MNSRINLEEVINARLSAVKVSHELEGRIRYAVAPRKRTYRRSVAFIVACFICVMVSVPVIAAQVPTFRAILEQLGVPYVYLLQPIQLVAEDQGIKMEVLAAINDEDEAVVYLTLQDLTGDRVDHTVDLYNYWISGGRSFTHELIDYDETSRTATIRMVSHGGKQWNGSKVTVRLSSFLSHREEFDLENTEINLKDIVNRPIDTQTLDMNNISGGGGELYKELKDKEFIDILRTDEIHKDIPKINFAYISNIGFVNRRLHVQTKWQESVDNHGYFYLQNKKGERVRGGSVHFGVDQQGKAVYGDEYVEYIFDINESEIDNYDLYGYFVKNNSFTTGNWETTFKFDAVDTTKKVAKDVNVGDVHFDQVTLTPLGVHIVSSLPSIAPLQVELVMKDGTSIELNSRIESQEAEGRFTVKHEAPLDVEAIKELRINGIVVPLK